MDKGSELRLNMNDGSEFVFQLVYVCVCVEGGRDIDSDQT